MDKQRKGSQQVDVGGQSCEEGKATREREKGSGAEQPPEEGSKKKKRRQKGKQGRGRRVHLPRRKKNSTSAQVCLEAATAATLHFHGEEERKNTREEIYTVILRVDHDFTHKRSRPPPFFYAIVSPVGMLYTESLMWPSREAGRTGTKEAGQSWRRCSGGTW